MSFKHIVGNIYKLLEFNRISINQLARLSDISLNGLKVMMQNGLFKLESLQKIADVFGVPLFILIADEITIEKTITGEGESVTINYKFDETSKFKVLNDGKKLNTVFVQKDNYFDKQESENQELQQRVAELQDQVDEKNDIISMLNEKVAMYREHVEILQQMNQHLKLMSTLFDKPSPTAPVE